MSWFYHVCPSSTQHQIADMTPTPANTLLSRTQYSNTANPPTLGEPMQDWLSCSSTGREDFSAAPQPAAPPSLENLSCSSLSSCTDGESVSISYISLQEQRCVLSWFLGWTTVQRERFMQDLLGKAVPGKVCTLLESLNTLQVKDRPPNIFECQLRLWTQWFESWSEEERNRFLHILEEKDAVFVAHFYRSVAGTAGRE
ncbi:uncharacterized protein C14orf119 homolog [Lampris incognitus]|uniref:uncharacterized protein C14orf119 homolog n=1 Tax=Lampris incognitus TaxID=2546036 RepID=UPI0024B58E51|nr:uncharacterized protein C14orf119 homolog [Lampris incognitus]